MHKIKYDNLPDEDDLIIDSIKNQLEAVLDYDISSVQLFCNYGNVTMFGHTFNSDYKAIAQNIIQNTDGVKNFQL
ncbi:hypothetical protein IZY60_06220 [Lutibacter sp. B2]|nr:hypothetical protein [Lutibacter sp. B2]